MGPADRSIYAPTDHLGCSNSGLLPNAVSLATRYVRGPASDWFQLSYFKSALAGKFLIFFLSASFLLAKSCCKHMLGTFYASVCLIAACDYRPPNGNVFGYLFLVIASSEFCILIEHQLNTSLLGFPPLFKTPSPASNIYIYVRHYITAITIASKV